MVPGARVELAWISPNDFESFASTISPAGQRFRVVYYRRNEFIFKMNSMGMCSLCRGCSNRASLDLKCHVLRSSLHSSYFSFSLWPLRRELPIGKSLSNTFRFLSSFFVLEYCAFYESSTKNEKTIRPCRPYEWEHRKKPDCFLNSYRFVDDFSTIIHINGCNDCGPNAFRIRGCWRQ